MEAGGLRPVPTQVLKIIIRDGRSYVLSQKVMGYNFIVSYF